MGKWLCEILTTVYQTWPPVTKRISQETKKHIICIEEPCEIVRKKDILNTVQITSCTGEMPYMRAIATGESKEEAAIKAWGLLADFMQQLSQQTTKIAEEARKAQRSLPTAQEKQTAGTKADGNEVVKS